MKKNAKTRRPVSARDRYDACNLVESIMNNEAKRAKATLKHMVNKRIGNTIRKITKTTDLI